VDFLGIGIDTTSADSRQPLASAIHGSGLNATLEDMQRLATIRATYAKT